MEDQAPYHANLAARLRTWLEAEGFTVREDAFPTLTLLAAQWRSPQGECFELVYTWQCGPSADSTCQLRAWTGNAHQEILFTAQRVRRPKHVQRLLWGCVRLTNAWLLAHPGRPLPF